MRHEYSIWFPFMVILAAALLSASAYAKEPVPGGTESAQQAGDIYGYKTYTREALLDSLVAEVTRIRDSAVEAGNYTTWGESTLILANRSARRGDYSGGAALMEDYIEHTTASAPTPACCSGLISLRGSSTM